MTVPRSPLRKRQNKRGVVTPLFCRLLSSGTARRPPHRRNAEFSRVGLQGAAWFAIMVPSWIGKEGQAVGDGYFLLTNLLSEDEKRVITSITAHIELSLIHI